MNISASGFDSARNVLKFGFGTTGDDDLRTFSSVRHGDCFADPLPRPRHDRDASC